MITGISHITFIVHDIEKATLFFENIFQAEMIYNSGEKTFSLSAERFFKVGNVWVAIMLGKPVPEKTYNHVAFKIDDCDFDEYEKRIKKMGIEIRESRNRIKEEGRSIYFYDYDNHLFELHTGTLNERLEAYHLIK